MGLRLFLVIFTEVYIALSQMHKPKVYTSRGICICIHLCGLHLDQDIASFQLSDLRFLLASPFPTSRGHHGSSSQDHRLTLPLEKSVSVDLHGVRSVAFSLLGPGVLEVPSWFCATQKSFICLSVFHCHRWS